MRFDIRRESLRIVGSIFFEKCALWLCLLAMVNAFLICCHNIRLMCSHSDFILWRHQMETFSASLAICEGNSPVTGAFPAQRPMTRSFDVFFDLCLNKRLGNQSWGWWLWRHCNDHFDRQCSAPNPVMCSQTLQWRHNESDGVSNHRCLDGLLNRLFRRRSKKTSKLRVTGLCEGNSPVTGEFRAYKGPV